MVVENNAFKGYCEATLGRPFAKITDDKKIALRKLFDDSHGTSETANKPIVDSWLNPNYVRYFLNLSSKVWLLSAALLVVGLGSYSACFTWNGVGTLANLVAGLASEAYTIAVSEEKYLWWNYQHRSTISFIIMLYNTAVYCIASLPLQVIRSGVWLMSRGKIKEQ